MTSKNAKREPKAVRIARQDGDLIVYKKARDAKGNEVIITLAVHYNAAVRWQHQDPDKIPGFLVGQIGTCSALQAAIARGEPVATAAKCRCESARVLDIRRPGDSHKLDVAFSDYAPHIAYRAGYNVYPDKWNDDPTNTCGGGIHFFLDYESARWYSI